MYAVFCLTTVFTTNASISLEIDNTILLIIYVYRFYNFNCRVTVISCQEVGITYYEVNGDNVTLTTQETSLLGRIYFRNILHIKKYNNI